jgi:hypothetical protein
LATFRISISRGATSILSYSSILLIVSSKLRMILPFLAVKNPALTGGALKTFKTISTVCCVHDADT